MKKLILLALFTCSLFALDMSIGANKDQSDRRDKTISKNKSINVSNDKSKSTDKAKVKETSLTKSSNVKKIEQTTALIALLALEQTDIEPFASCQILSNPRLPKDFGLTAMDEYGEIEDNIHGFLQNAVTYGYSLNKTLNYNEDMTYAVLSYMNCVGLYGALIAQDQVEGKFSVALKNKELKSLLQDFSKSLDPNQCKVFGSLKEIVCSSSKGKSKLSLDYTPQVLFTDITLYSNDTYFGYSASQSTDKARRIANSKTITDSKKKSKALSLAKSINNNKSFGNSIAKSASQNLSLGKFIPGD